MRARLRRGPSLGDGLGDNSLHAVRVIGQARQEDVAERCMHQFCEAGIDLGLGLSVDLRLELRGLCRVRLGGAGLRDCRRGVVRLDVGLRSVCGVRLGLRWLRRLRWSDAFDAAGIGALCLCAVSLSIGLRPGRGVRLGLSGLRRLRRGDTAFGAAGIGVLCLYAVRLRAGLRRGFDLGLGGCRFRRIRLGVVGLGFRLGGHRSGGRLSRLGFRIRRGFLLRRRIGLRFRPGF